MARILGSSNSSKSLGFLLDWHKEEWNIFALKMEKMDFLLIDKKRQRGLDGAAAAVARKTGQPEKRKELRG